MRAKYTIEVRPGARQALSRLGETLRHEVAVVIDGLASDPLPEGAKRLKGALRGMHRVRFGPRASHRLLYVIEEPAKRITVAAIGPRGDVYKTRRVQRLKRR